MSKIIDAIEELTEAISQIQKAKNYDESYDILLKDEHRKTLENGIAPMWVNTENITKEAIKYAEYELILKNKEIILVNAYNALMDDMNEDMRQLAVMQNKIFEEVLEDE